MPVFANLQRKAAAFEIARNKTDTDQEVSGCVSRCFVRRSESDDVQGNNPDVVENLSKYHACPKGHELFQHCPQGLFTCDFCGVTPNAGDEMHGCPLCDYDRCQQCHGILLESDDDALAEAVVFLNHPDWRCQERGFQVLAHAAKWGGRLPAVVGAVAPLLCDRRWRLRAVAKRIVGVCADADPDTLVDVGVLDFKAPGFDTSMPQGGRLRRLPHGIKHPPLADEFALTALAAAAGTIGRTCNARHHDARKPWQVRDLCQLYERRPPNDREKVCSRIHQVAKLACQHPETSKRELGINLLCALRESAESRLIISARTKQPPNNGTYNTSGEPCPVVRSVAVHAAVQITQDASGGQQRNSGGSAQFGLWLAQHGLDDTDAIVRYSALEAISESPCARLGSIGRNLISRFGDSRALVRFRAAKLVPELAPTGQTGLQGWSELASRFRTDLKKMVLSSDAWIQRAAFSAGVRAAAQAGSWEMLTETISLLPFSSEMEGHILKVLEETKVVQMLNCEARHLKTLVRALCFPDAEQRKEARLLMAQKAKQDPAGITTSFLRADNSSLRKAALEAVGTETRSSRSIIDDIFVSLHGGSWRLRRAAGRAIGDLIASGSMVCAERATKLIQTRHGEAKRHLEEALAQGGDLEETFLSLQSPNPNVRANAIALIASTAASGRAPVEELSQRLVHIVFGAASECARSAACLALVAASSTCPNLAAPACRGLLSGFGLNPEDFVCTALALLAPRGDEKVVKVFCNLAKPRDDENMERPVQRLALRLLRSVAGEKCGFVKDVGEQCIEQANRHESDDLRSTAESTLRMLKLSSEPIEHYTPCPEEVARILAAFNSDNGC